MKFYIKSKYQYLFVPIFKFVLIGLTLLIVLARNKKRKLMYKVALSILTSVFVLLIVAPIIITEIIKSEFYNTIYGSIYFHVIGMLIGVYFIQVQKKLEHENESSDYQCI